MEISLYLHIEIILLLRSCNLEIVRRLEVFALNLLKRRRFLEPGVTCHIYSYPSLIVATPIIVPRNIYNRSTYR